MADSTASELPELARLEAASFIDSRGLDTRIPRLEQYFGPWLILQDHLQMAVDRFNAMNLRLHIREHEELRAQSGGSGSGRGYQLSKGGVAVIDIAGSLMKGESSMDDSSTSTVRIRQAVRAATNDNECSAILLRIDSPGGTVSGTEDLGKDVAAAAAKKPVYAYCEDLCCSAAYWVASQANKVYSNATARIGSIGVYQILEDSSAASEKEGIKVHVVKAGAYKGTGIEGTEVTADQLSEVQQMIDGLNEHFVRAVASGRKMTLAAVREVNDGRAYLAADALKNGLIDGVQSFDETLAQLSTKKPKPSSKGTNAMSTENAGETTVATYEQIKTACIGADAGFLCSQLDGKATIEQARTAWMTEQNKRTVEAKAETDKAKADAKAEIEQVKAQAAKPGAPAVPAGGKRGASETDSEASGDAIDQWNAAVQKKLDAYSKLNPNSTEPDHKRRSRAIAAVVTENRALHKAYLEAYPAAHEQAVSVHASRARETSTSRGY